jgi:hypothetical protein
MKRDCSDDGATSAPLKKTLEISVAALLVVKTHPAFLHRAAAASRLSRYKGCAAANFDQGASNWFRGENIR